MPAVWAALAILAIFVAAPGLFGSFLIAERRSPEQLRTWFTVLTLVNLVALIVGIIAMPKG
ncbi:MAG: hypothetical protein EPO21_13740 [Chloroflexota bacterium]|nr:MAG: hypothetical protein EPO21_13740 [Chloroflexota bacterium]